MANQTKPKTNLKGRKSTKKTTQNSKSTKNAKLNKSTKVARSKKSNATKSSYTKSKSTNRKTTNKTTTKKTQNKNTNKRTNTKRTSITKRRVTKKEKPSVKVIFLGGLNEIGKNITLFECQNDIIMLDCGMAFPDGDMLGVDLVIPDFTYVEQNKDKIKGIVITHGHEDHIGALPYLLKNLNVPVYGTKLTIGLIENKLREHTFDHKVNLIPVEDDAHIKLGCFDVEMIHVNHSVPDSCGVALHTPAGLLVHTGDFKIDFTPMSGGMTNLTRLAELGKEGVLALFADSTNADREGHTPTEQTVAESLDSLFRQARRKRIIIATFASNISRVQQIINCADKYTRKIAFSGKSMINIMKTAQDLGYLKVPENIIVDINEINNYAPDKIVIITTGSQGEPMAALSRMANSEHKQVEVGPGDFIIISANPIPGNENAVGNVVDELLKKGCDVIYESMYDVHVSGHACVEELKLMQSLVKPKYFIPVHGEQKHLRKHMDISLSLGMDRKNIYIGDIGKVVELNEKYIKEVETVQAGQIFVDGLGVGDVGDVVLRDRKRLSEDGLIVITCLLDSYDRRLVAGPNIVSRGFVYVRESEDLLDEIKETAINALDYCERKRIRDWTAIKTKVKDDVSKLVLHKTKRSPMILTILMDA